MIYFFIFLIKKLSSPPLIKSIIDKYMTYLPSIKNNKAYYTEYRTFIDKELSESLFYLYDGIIQMTDHSIFSQLKELFYDVTFVKISISPATFRKELKDLSYTLYQLKLDLMDILEDEAKTFNETKMSVMADPLGLGKKNKNAVQIEMEKLQIRRLSIYGEKVDTPQMIIYVIAKIFLKTLNEMIKIKKFSVFGYQQIQIDLCFIISFFKDYLIAVDIENILDGFNNEIINNCQSNTVGFEESKQLNDDLVKSIIELYQKEFNEIQIKSEEENKEQQ